MTLYLGLELPPHLKDNPKVIHCPIIQIIPRSITDPAIQKTYEELPSYTHLLFTSKTAVRLFFAHLQTPSILISTLQNKCFVAVGHATAQCLQEHKLSHIVVAQDETAEGVIAVLKQMDLTRAHLFWPHSALSRPILNEFLNNLGRPHHTPVFYDTITKHPDTLPDLQNIQEIVFTSSSTVSAFCEIFGTLPTDKKLIAIGPVTERHLHQLVKAQD
ncbi:MAG: uroporphyrinogen-III synthase [Parachlamydiaceae bacterium]|nr:uroporphyrinogen-III synthase [Parachlamydiaceae bacterium]